MATLLLLTNDMHASSEILPALELLPHQVKVAQAEATALLDAPVRRRHPARRPPRPGRRPLALPADRDDRQGVAAARHRQRGWARRAVVGLGLRRPAADVCRPGRGRRPHPARHVAVVLRPGVDPLIQSGNIVIDEAGYSAKLNGQQLDLTYTEFELLKYLAQHPGRVFSRQQLLSDVWGYDYYGGTRTVDVHVRRLRAKLGPEYESMIGTVRNVGYRFVTPTEEASARV